MNLSGPVRVGGGQPDVLVLARAQPVRELRLGVAAVDLLRNGSVQIVKKICVELLLLLTRGSKTGLEARRGKVSYLLPDIGLTQMRAKNRLRWN